jgi:hypothetical protein
MSDKLPQIFNLERRDEGWVVGDTEVDYAESDGEAFNDLCDSVANFYNKYVGDKLDRDKVTIIFEFDDELYVGDSEAGIFDYLPDDAAVFKWQTDVEERLQELVEGCLEEMDEELTAESASHAVEATIPLSPKQREFEKKLQESHKFNKVKKVKWHSGGKAVIGPFNSSSEEQRAALSLAQQYGNASLDHYGNVWIDRWWAD